MTSPSRGIYFLANDPYIGWVRAFLESLRAWNPGIALRLIPFDDRIDGVMSMASTYDFAIHSGPGLEDLDELGRSLLMGTGLVPGTFRKLACFWGPFDQFIFLDADIIVTVEVDRLIATLDQRECDFAFAHPTAWDSVYTSAPLQAEVRAGGYQSGINTGAWASRRGLFSLDLFRRLGTEILPRRQELVLDGEQSFINWSLYRQSVKVDTFSSVMEGGGFLWAGDTFPLRIALSEGRPILQGKSGDPAFLVHWAGFGLGAGMPYRDLWRKYRWPSTKKSARLARGLDHVSAFVARAGRRLRSSAT